MTKKIAEILSELDLKPHPEGGYFKETYRSIGEIKKKIQAIIILAKEIIRLVFIFF